MPQNLVFKKIGNTNKFNVINGKELLGILTIDCVDKKKSRVQFEKGFKGNQEIAEKRLVDLYYTYKMMSPMTA